MKKIQNCFVGTILFSFGSLAVFAQDKALVNTSASPYAKLSPVDMNAVKWTEGFWADRFDVCRKVMVPELWKTYMDADKCHSFKNFEIAAGLDTGRFRGPSFHDGDFYKTLESVAALYASTKDERLDHLMDHAIDVIARSQRADGYIYTKSVIEQKKTGVVKQFDDRLSFEAYNIGHLMTAACIHYRATGKTTLLNVAKKAGDFLIAFYDQATPEQARNAICPSHYMGITELYRTTGERRYLELVTKLIDIRGTTEGTDDNSDRAPFREMKKVVGHAVRANYLFAGVADVYSETGDQSLMETLHRLWDNVIHTKMYITGGCGALYDGVSVDGTSYKPDTVQRVHQAYGRDFQLPNFSAHNETCANIGNVLWNWRMLQITGDSRYADVVELALYNSVLSGISLDGEKFFYTNPLAATSDYPYHLRWMGGRQKYISLSNCCPPNVVRTVAEVNNYLYSIAENGLYLHLYGGNILDFKLKNGSKIRLDQKTAYPWEGRVQITVQEAPKDTYSIFLRIPGWCGNYRLSVNGKAVAAPIIQHGYVKLKRSWKKGDLILLDLDMRATLMEANPLVEEVHNRVAVQRGPVVYCLESAGLQPGQDFHAIRIPLNAEWKSKEISIADTRLFALEADVHQIPGGGWNQKSLYRPVVAGKPISTTVRLIPYFAWANRGKTDMAVWLPRD